MTVRTTVHSDPSERKVTFRRVQDVEDIIETNKRLQNEPQRRETFHHIASIPNVFLERWLNEEYLRGNVNLRLFTPEFDKLVMKKLRDPEWSWLRTTDKRF